MSSGSWTYVRHVDFGTNGASKIMLRAKGEGTVELRLTRKGAKASATFNISSDEMDDYVVDVDPSKVFGTKNIYLIVTSGTDLYLDAWQATEAQTEGIVDIESNEPVKRKVYDLSGRRLPETHQHHGIVIEQYVDGKGKKHNRKRM